MLLNLINKDNIIYEDEENPISIRSFLIFVRFLMDCKMQDPTPPYHPIPTHHTTI